METKYWTSLSQLNGDPQFIEKSHKEFLSSPLQEEESGVSRRDFMKLMAASTAVMTTGCFQRPSHKILPYINQPEEVTFGIANHYASTCGECAASCGVLVKTREGRPLKMEGNPEHPVSQGGLCARGQASILNLYDPDRLRNPVTVTRGSGVTTAASWKEVDKKIAEKLRVARTSGGRVKLLTENINSPSTQKLITEFLKAFPKGEHVAYSALSDEDIVSAQEMSYGKAVMPNYRFDRADLVVSLDADFLGTWVDPVGFTKQWAPKRKVSAKKHNMSRLVSFNSAMTITAANSDESFAIRSIDTVYVAYALAAELAAKGHGSVSGAAAEALKNYSADKVASLVGIEAKALKRIAAELAEHKGKSLVVAGSAHSRSVNSLSLQVAVNLLNSILGNDGITVDATVSPGTGAALSSANILRLIAELNAGNVDALFIAGPNPVYTLPKRAGFVEAAAKAPLVVSFNERADETTAVCDFVLPTSHSLESWGDAEAHKDVLSLKQPTIRPIYDTRQFEDSIIALSEAAGLGISSFASAKDFHGYLKNYWKDVVYKEFGTSSVAFELFWEDSLRQGVIDGVRRKGGQNRTASGRSFKSEALTATKPVLAKATGEYELNLIEQVAMGDGRSANNPWLQELPDPISRVTWDNYVSIAPKTASALGITEGDIVKVTRGTESFKLPALIQPGLHEKVLNVALGYGRTRAGNIGTKIGENMFALAEVLPKGTALAGFAVSMAKTGAKSRLAAVQEHHTLEGRPIVKEASLEEYAKDPAAGNESEGELTTLWPEHKTIDYKWGMAIDLNSCTGCQACVVACSSENNVPTVGRDSVMRGRIMHWIRIDRYYTGTPDAPAVVHQPMLCQHCENAPCETVCPVIATSHDNEGLNTMTYNRCVGTRYCANNCPYKVRRFNWFDYNYGESKKVWPRTMAQNPEVTVRSRGVMEKCSFCVQRIHEAKNTARDEGRPVKDGEIKTACQQGCPADAITFGNLNDPKSAVSQLSKDKRAFHVLEELNVRPSISYLTKIRNGERA